MSADDVEGMWDSARLVQLLTNLLTNALQRGDAAGVVSVTVSTRVNSVLIEIYNEGEPINPDTLGALFDPLYRRASTSSKTRTPRIFRTWVGTAIASQIARSHGGDITSRIHTRGRHYLFDRTAKVLFSAASSHARRLRLPPRRDRFGRYAGVLRKRLPQCGRSPRSAWGQQATFTPAARSLGRHRERLVPRLARGSIGFLEWADATLGGGGIEITAARASYRRERRREAAFSCLSTWIRGLL